LLQSKLQTNQGSRDIVITNAQPQHTKRHTCLHECCSLMGTANHSKKMPQKTPFVTANSGQLQINESRYHTPPKRAMRRIYILLTTWLTYEAACHAKTSPAAISDPPDKSTYMQPNLTILVPAFPLSYVPVCFTFHPPHHLIAIIITQSRPCKQTSAATLT